MPAGAAGRDGLQPLGGELIVLGLFNTLVNVIIVLSANAFIKKISDVGLF